MYHTRYITAFFLLLAMSIINGQSKYFYVLDIKGEILNKRTQALISLNDKIFDTDALIFKTPDAVARVLSSDKGIFKIRYKQGAEKSKSIGSLVKALLIPSPSRLSTRSTIDFEGEFGEEYLYIGTVHLNVPIPQNSTSYYLSLSIGNKNLSHRLLLNSDTLTIDIKSIESYVGTMFPLDTPLSATLYLSSGEAQIVLHNFKINILSQKTLKDLTNPVFKIANRNKYSLNDIQEIIRNILFDEYPGSFVNTKAIYEYAVLHK